MIPKPTIVIFTCDLQAECFADPNGNEFIGKRSIKTGEKGYLIRRLCGHTDFNLEGRGPLIFTLESAIFDAVSLPAAEWHMRWMQSLLDSD
jgi:hypothetical protein